MLRDPSAVFEAGQRLMLLMYPAILSAQSQKAAADASCCLLRQNAPPSGSHVPAIGHPAVLALPSTEHGLGCLYSCAQDGWLYSSTPCCSHGADCTETDRQPASMFSFKAVLLTGHQSYTIYLPSAQCLPMCSAQSHGLPADMVRAALKEPARTKARTREVVYFRQAMWKDGKPEKQGKQVTACHVHDPSW